MPELERDLAELVETLVRPLVEAESALEVTSSTGDSGHIMIEIRVDADDAGKVIGRQGKNIKAIRTLARAAATRKDASVDVELID